MGSEKPAREVSAARRGAAQRRADPRGLRSKNISNVGVPLSSTKLAFCTAAIAESNRIPSAASRSAIVADVSMTCAIPADVGRCPIAGKR